MGGFYVPKIRNVTVRAEGGMVQLIENGTLILEVPWEAAKTLSRAMRQQAARAEQDVKVNRVIKDQATLIRAGFPLRLTNRPDVFKEAGNEAAHDRELRRMMPGGIPSGVAFGIPTIRHKPKPPKGIISGVGGVPSGEAFGKF